MILIMKSNNTPNIRGSVGSETAAPISRYQTFMAKGVKNVIIRRSLSNAKK